MLKFKIALLAALVPLPALAQTETRLPCRWTKADAEFFRDNPDAHPRICQTTDIIVTTARTAQLRDETGLSITSLDANEIGSKCCAGPIRCRGAVKRWARSSIS